MPANEHRAIERVDRPRGEAARNYDRLSRTYDLVTSSEWPFIAEGLELLDARPGERVLEIGFGTGRALVELARAVGERGLVCGIDISPEMVRLSRQKLAEYGLESRVNLETEDAYHLPYEADRFDALFMSFTLELFDTPEIPHVVSECLRVTRPGGRACVVSMSKQGGPYPVRRLYEWARTLAPSLLDCRPIFAAVSMEHGGFTLAESHLRRMWGIPVEFVLAKNGDTGRDYR
ncbi:MAG: class I SAM-dependent methyltransferase, partial [Spirochaetota bacterium]